MWSLSLLFVLLFICRPASASDASTDFPNYKSFFADGSWEPCLLMSYPAILSSIAHNLSLFLISREDYSTPQFQKCIDVYLDRIGHSPVEMNLFLEHIDKLCRSVDPKIFNDAIIGRMSMIVTSMMQDRRAEVEQTIVKMFNGASPNFVKAVRQMPAEWLPSAIPPADTPTDNGSGDPTKESTA